jgi:hypothetical protein
VLTIFSMEAGLIYLVTLYLHEVMHLSPLSTGLAFDVPASPRLPRASLRARLSLDVARDPCC